MDEEELVKVEFKLGRQNRILGFIDKKVVFPFDGDEQPEPGDICQCTLEDKEKFYIAHIVTNDSKAKREIFKEGIRKATLALQTIECNICGGKLEETKSRMTDTYMWKRFTCYECGIEVDAYCKLPQFDVRHRVSLHLDDKTIVEIEKNSKGNRNRRKELMKEEIIKIRREMDRNRDRGQSYDDED
jgi:hypothetical protein